MAAKRSLGSVTGQVARQESHAHVTRMTSVGQRRYGPPDVLALEEIDRPIVCDRDVLLRVHAVGLNAVWSIAGAPGLAARDLAAAVGCPRVDWSGRSQLARQPAGDLPLAHPT